MDKQEYSGEERRALNMIWTAARDYSFRPEFMAFDGDGEADLYLNSIIGYTQRWFDSPRLSELFGSFQGAALQDVYDTVLWLGLESAAYEKEREGRPVLKELRRDYWDKVLKESRQNAREGLVQALQTGRAGRVLGEKPGFPFMEQGILDELDFDASADTEQIAERVRGLLWKYFRFNCSTGAENGKKRRRIIPRGFLRPVRSIAVRSSLPAGENCEEQESGQNPQEGEKSKKREAGPRGRKGLKSWLENVSLRREEEVRSYIEACYGISMYGESQNQALRRLICTGCHSGCFLHVTRGERFLKAPADGEAARQLWAAAEQRERNREHYEKHRAEYRQSIRLLSERIRSTLLVDLQPVPERGPRGMLEGRLAWRAACLEDHRVFVRQAEEERPNVSVDLMLDASASRMGHEAVIAAQGYVIAESLTRCGIPVRVYSFSTIQGCTVFRIFRDYREQERNLGILDYVAAGWNRDGLAIRAAGHLLEDSPCEKRLLIVLTDASPNDEQRMASNEGLLPGREYSGEAGIEDTASEVRLLRKSGVRVMAVFYGLDSDLEGARRIYGSDFARIKDMGQLADAVGNLIAGRLKESLEGA